MKKIIYLFLILIICIKIFGRSFTIEELEELREKELITFEDYKILRDEIEAVLEEYFTLSVNSRKVSNQYRVVKFREKTYLNLEEFFKIIGFGNYKRVNGNYEILLGNSFRKVTINLKENRVEDEKSKKEYTELFIEKDSEIYIDSTAFRDIFLADLTIDDSYSKIGMELNFMSPEEIEVNLDIEAKKIEEQNDENILLYTGERQLFDLGYARVIAERSFSKNSGESYKGEWNSSLEYQGGLLFGQIKTKYNLEDNNIDYAILEYTDIWNGHTLNLENRGEKKGGREWSFGFFKDKGYYLDGNRAIIVETVPVGSRAELRYMGASIAIKNEENGTVIFDNPIIKTDRTYELIVYTPEGEILRKSITTVKDYNKQESGQTQYTVLVKEKQEAKRFSKDFEMFYGLTDNLTIGAGYTQGIESIEERYKYVNDIKTSLVYGGTYNGYSYIFDFNMEKSLDNYTDSDNRKFEDRFKYEGTGELNVGRFKYILNGSKYRKFYSKKHEEEIEVRWDATENLRVGYSFEKIYNYVEKDEKNSNFIIDFDKNYKDILFSIGAEVNQKNDQSYNVGVYYTGMNNISTKVETKWESGKEKDAETVISLYNNNFLGILDYNIEAGYSREYKDKFIFNFTMNYDNWLKITSAFDENRKRDHSVGLDRIIDLKNPLKNLNSIDVSRIKAITYIDENNNNEYDSNEEKIQGVEITIGEEVKTTDADGVAIFSNISNGIIHNIEPKIKKPSFTLGENKFQIKSGFSSTVQAYIPIKPMITLSGVIKIDESLTLSDIEKEQIFDDILIEIKDLKGKSLDLVVPDNTGSFDISGLFPEEYIIKVNYVGSRFDIPMLEKKLKLKYSSEIGFENTIELNFEDNKIVAKI